MTMQYEDIIFTVDRNIATVRFNRPKAMNSLSPRMMAEFSYALKDIRDDPDIRVMILTGNGRAFCAGADVKAMAEDRFFTDRDGKGGVSGEVPEANRGLSIKSLDKPVIAAINGYAVGAGLDYALSCDIRIASDQAKLTEAYIRRGLIPGPEGIHSLPRLVGLDNACEVIWTGNMIDAHEALEIGLVTKVVPHDELDEAALELAEKLAKGPPLAIQAAKRAIYAAMNMTLEETFDLTDRAVAELSKTEDHKEGALAFMEKREPKFRGK